MYTAASLIETEEHRRTYAAECLSVDCADREDMPEMGDDRRAAVDEYLETHTWIVVGAAER